MAKLSLFFCITLACLYAEASVSVVKTWTLPSDFKIEKKRVGGFSGCSLNDNKMYFISDDRGSEGGPRIFSIPFDEAKPEIGFSKVEVISVKKDSVNKILDLEGIAVLNKNKILVSSEGDLNQKPRINPTLFWIDGRGNKLSTIQFPEAFIAEKSGQQTKGIQVNLGFEGLSIDEDQKKWAAMLEGPLLQEPNELKLVESAIDSDKFDSIFSYPIPTLYSINPTQPPGLVGYFGVSDILFLDQAGYMILERGVRLTAGGVTYLTQLCQATKDKAQLKRQCFYSMNDDQQLKELIPNGANFEGLCWVNKQKKLFMAVSDNNFSKSEKTVFILYQLN